MGEDETIIQRVKGKGERRRGRAYLTVLSGQAVGRIFRLTVGETTIGRGTTADVRINEDGVSRLHAKIVRELDGTAKIMDLNSTNGTYVNGRRIDIESLREGDRVRVGQSATLDFRYEYLSPSGESEAPEAGEESAEEGSMERKQRGYDNIAGALDSLGKLYSQSKQYDQAIKAYRRTLAIREKKFGPKHPAVAAILDTIGAALMEKGDHREAITCHRRALQIYESLPARKPPPEMAHVLVNLGSGYLAAKEPRQALEPLERARDLLEARNASAPELAPVRFALARAYAAVGRMGDGTRRLAEQAKEGFAEAIDRAMRGRVAEVDSWLESLPK